MEFKKVEDIEISHATKLVELVEQFSRIGGFVAKKVWVASNILDEMFKEKDCLKFLSFPACIVATGLRGVIKDLIRKKLFNVVITTCGTLDHDLARIWKDYYQGSFLMDDRELRKKGINRLGNVLVPDESYGLIIEEKMNEFLDELYASGKKELASYELVWELGKWVGEEGKNSIIYWCYKRKVPMIVPGITDGAVGYQLWQFWQEHKDFNINVLRDEQLLSDLVWNAKKSGALMIGGGISKHHTIWWNQFKDGLDYAVYITTAVEWDGSLSGARTREAISWKKLKSNAKHVTVEGDATVLLPLIVSKFL